MNAPRRSGPRRAKKPTPERLANIALHYLGRYAASEASLRRVLENRLRRAVMQDDAFAADLEPQKTLRAAIDRIVEQYKQSGVINDAAFAQMKVRSLRRTGGSARKISMKLQQKGLSAEHIDGALGDAEEGDPLVQEERAARAFARRRGLGCFRKEKGVELSSEEQKKSRAKDVASMARAGFSYDVIQKVLDGSEEGEG